MGRSRLLLADDHQLVADGIRRLLEPEFEIAATEGDGRAAIKAYERLRPDLLVLDVGLPLLNGIEVARQVKAADPAARILFVTMHTERVYVEEALRTGASGYMLKQEAGRDLVAAVRTVLGGWVYISPAILAKYGKSLADPARRTDARAGQPLTTRQREVLQLVAEGKSMKEIAGILDISVRTVEFHKNGIMEQLGLRTTAELTRYALEQGLAADGLPGRERSL